MAVIFPFGYPFGGDSSKYSYVSFAISLVMSVPLLFAWRERLVYESEVLKGIRESLMIVSLYAASASALGSVVFSTYRWFHTSHIGNGPEVIIALSGLVISLISLLSVFGNGPKRWLVALSRVVLTIVWFGTVLDNINW